MAKAKPQPTVDQIVASYHAGRIEAVASLAEEVARCIPDGCKGWAAAKIELRNIQFACNRARAHIEG